MYQIMWAIRIFVSLIFDITFWFQADDPPQVVGTEMRTATVANTTDHCHLESLKLFSMIIMGKHHVCNMASPCYTYV